MKRSNKLNFLLMMLSVSVLFVMNCSSSNSIRRQSCVVYDVGTTTDSVVAPDVVLENGDEIEVKFVDTPELNDRQTIRPDGKISMPIAGEVVATGKTPAALTNDLTTLFSKELINPKLVVIVRSFGNRKIYVGGEVKNQGVFPLSENVSVYEGILLAGGFNNPKAKLKNVVVIRNSAEKRKVYVFDSRKPQLMGQFYLQPRDIIYVPEKTIVNVDDWVDQYISSVIPKLPFYFNAPIN
jgi:polysaccharide biosynthesis/export protein PslD